MRKIILLFIVGFVLIGCTNNKPKEMTLKELIDSIELANEIDDDILLPETYKLNDKDVIATWESDNTDVINNTGEVSRQQNNVDVSLVLTLTDGNDTEFTMFTITVIGYSKTEFIDNALDKIIVVNQTKESLLLPQSLYYLNNRIAISWSSSNPKVLSNDGKVGLIANDTEVEITASITHQDETKSKTFKILVLALKEAEKAEYIFDNLAINFKTSTDIILPLNFEFGLTGTWVSSNEDVISNNGVINKNLKGSANATLTLMLSNSIGRIFDVEIVNYNHLIIDRTFGDNKENVVLDNNKLVLADNALTGTYTTNEISTFNFTEAVASWAAITSTEATCELFIRVSVNGVWSKYFSYGNWGKGLQNKAVNQNDTIAKLSADEIIIANSKTADKLQMKIVLTRNTLTTASPIVTLLAVALNIPNYTYNVDISNIRREVVYDVPQLYQHDVPDIGGIICSATSSTMLLKYKGHNFADLADYEHEYIAGIVKDYGNNIYGNWVYNTVGMGSFGETSYVKRMYSADELLLHLDEVGPIAASIKGQTNVRFGKSYFTNGHLIVVKGYRYDDNQLYILVNDPNLKNVSDEMKVEDFMNVWRNVLYVVE